MKIIPVAFDSFGVRSMATFVETNDCSIFIDPSAALGPVRYNLPPHPLELMRLDECWKKIRELTKKADVMTVTHYHYDHHDPDQPELYKGKLVYIKHPKENINKSQKERAAYFLEKIEGLPKEVILADGTEGTFGKTRITFSQAVPHGANNKLGYVTEVCVDDGHEVFVHTSDVEGPSLKEQADFILKHKPTTMILDGPLSYMLGYRYSQGSLDESVKNMIKIMKDCPLKNLVIDHHFLRDLKWRERVAAAIKVAEEKKIVFGTAADFAGRKLEMLEANRNQLFKQFPGMKVPNIQLKTD